MSEVGEAIQTIRCRDVTFHLTPTKIAVETRLQFFLLEPKEPYFHVRLKTVRLLVELREIDGIDKLLGYSQGKLNWTPYRKKWMVELVEKERERNAN